MDWRFCLPGRAGGRIIGVIPFRIGKAIADAALAELVARQNAVNGVSSAIRRKTAKIASNCAGMHKTTINRDK